MKGYGLGTQGGDRQNANQKKCCGMIRFLGKIVVYSDQRDKLTSALILGGFLGIDRHAVM